MDRTRRAKGDVLPKRSGLLLAAALSSAAVLAACADKGDRNDLLGSQDGAIASADGKPAGAAGSGGSGSALPSISAKEYFTTKVQQALSTSCAQCHATGPGPAWIAPEDVERSYALQFQRAYVSLTSPILKQGVHDGGTAPALSADAAQTYSIWVQLELKERGGKTPDGILTKLGGCLDKTKFDAIGFDKLITTPRNADNNPGKEAEDANTCDGCNNVQCSTCHSDDAATGFLMALGNDIFPADHTFTDMKTTTPPYMQKYFGLDVDGTPIGSKAIQNKSNATVAGKAYSHPMFTLTADQSTALEAFVNDAVAKFKSGACGK
jgi:hypothetical protein